MVLFDDSKDFLRASKPVTPKFKSHDPGCAAIAMPSCRLANGLNYPKPRASTMLEFKPETKPAYDQMFADFIERDPRVSRDEQDILATVNETRQAGKRKREEDFDDEFLAQPNSSKRHVSRHPIPSEELYMNSFGSHQARQFQSLQASLGGGVQIPVNSGFQQGSQGPYVKPKTEMARSSCRVNAGRGRRGQRGPDALIHWQWQKAFMPSVPLPMPQYCLYDIIFSGMDTISLDFIISELT